jgi:MtrB/PioB family decaheme-associated outer membrane protein
MRTDSFRLGAMAAAVAAAFGAAPAFGAEGDDEARALSKPESEVALGAGYVSEDNRRFGQYNGLHEKGGYLLLDADIVRRDDRTGTWLRFNARDLGLDSRELRFEHNRQGDWGYFIDFSQIPRFNPYEVRTGLQGIGTASQTVVPVAPGSGALQDLETRRDALTLGLKKSVGASGWNFAVRFKNEQKEGARMWGQGTSPGAPNVNFLTDPIDYEIRQLDATASYNGERIQLTGGYYGTDFQNANLALNVSGGIAALSPMALPPGNQSHQLYVNGGYNLTPTTRATFKLAKATATQTDAFPVTPTTVARTTLDGRVDTTQAQLGISARPLPKLSLLANLRFEDRDDKTPIDNYLVTGVSATTTFDGTNEPRSIRTSFGRLEATYAFPGGVRGLAGIDYEEKKRNQFRVRSVSNREKTDETTYRLEARRTLGETLTGSLGFAHSERGGSPFLDNILNGGGPGSNKIAPVHLADRKRDAVRLTLGWTPAEALSLQLRADAAKDDYDARNFEELGLRDGKANLVSLDAGYRMSEAWDVHAFAARAQNKLRQAVCSSPANGAACTGPITEMRPEHTSDGFGANLTGAVRANLKIGAELTYFDLNDQYALEAASGVQPAALPDINTKVTTLRLFADYALARNSGVRAQWIHDTYKTDDWTWQQWTYSDGTRVTQEPKQEVDFIGVQYYYRFQ